MDIKSFFKELKGGCDHFLNINHILDKLNFDNFLERLYGLFKEIINNEIQFAFKEIKNLEKNIKKIDLEKEIKINNNIFKENLKLITNQLIDKISKNWFKRRKEIDNLNDIVIQEEDNESETEKEENMLDPNKILRKNLKLNLKKKFKKKKFFENDPLSEKRRFKKKKSNKLISKTKKIIVDNNSNNNNKNIFKNKRINIKINK